MRKPSIAALVGLGVGVLAFLLMRWMSDDFLIGARGLEDLRPTLTWWMVLGIGIGGAAAAAVRYHPLIAAVPAGLLLLLYLPMFISLTNPSWYPNWLRTGIHISFTPIPYVVIGVLVAASAWSMVERYRMD